jgi:hypothetical protein
VTSMVEQQRWNLREDLEATWRDMEATRRDFEVQLAAVEARKRRAGDGNAGAKADKVKQPKLDGSTSWAMVHRQCEVAAIHPPRAVMHHHHHHQWHYSPINEPWPLLGFSLIRFSTNYFLQVKVVSLTHNPQPGGPGLRIYIPGDRVAQQHPRTLGSSGTSGSPFPVPIYVGPWGSCNA